ncbi:signal recognition particle-docking protein FtsY [Planctomicrobium sp.]|jgi:fused signal recognition particle receptor|nr:signal recognition particle-docking protein FtsY [Planctomicrobium sp.]MBT5019849.1 signal recognition particle-docking protein FtsY [Planctomicrobium sp.]MDB4439384.1 signal recognition particle-docking protein FtsY [Planctomicrobium sp.]MDB4743385.1 signal recognition particle-docking protein FtsY [Planctomicrobium sp.]
MALFGKLKSALKKTKDVLRTDVRDLLKAGEILDEQKLEEFHRGLITTDMGVEAAGEVIDSLRKEFGGRTVDPNAIWKDVKGTLKEILTGDGSTTWNQDDPLSPLNMAETGPTVILVSGVNGVGKTTSIAKLANYISKAGQKVVLAAGDTFRAAAVEQLTMWSERIGCDIVKKDEGADPASVAFAGCDQAANTNADVAIIDTAGRLQTQQNLMQELEKIHRVIGKRIPDAPHESLLVLDATTGQNGISQASKFSEAAKCTGIILTKLDGTAKGGVVVAIRKKMGIPVKYIGVGEQIDDLQLFSPDDFVEALFEEV